MENQILLSDYEESHRPDQQHFAEGVAIHPNLRTGFDQTPLTDRDPEEVRDWWHRPYILTTSWQEIGDRLEQEALTLKAGHLLEFTSRKNEIQQQQLNAKAEWFHLYPSGIRYEVRCLDGKSSDQSTSWGMESTLEAAIRRAKKGPTWQSSFSWPSSQLSNVSSLSM